MRAPLIALAALTLTACSSTDTTAAEDTQTRLAAAYDACSPPIADLIVDDPQIFALDDGDMTLLLNPPSSTRGKVAMGDVARCVFDETGAPATVSQQLGATQEAMGPQSATWDGMTFTWSIRSGAELVASFTEGVA